MCSLFAGGYCSAQFGPAIIIDTTGATSGLIQRLQVADVDGDGHRDILHATGNMNHLRYHKGNGNSVSATAQVIPGNFGFISDVQVADYNSDGLPDIVVLDKQARAIHHYQNVGGSFPGRNTMFSSSFTPNHPNTMLSVDFTGDSRPDLLVLDHIDVLLFKNNGGGFDSAVSIVPASLQTEFYHIAWGKFNNDAFPDFAITSSSGFLIFLNNGTGQFAYSGLTNCAISFLIAAGDLNGDGIDDIVLKDNAGKSFINNGNATFATPQLLNPANVSYRSFSIADMDGDGDKDLYAVYDQTNQAVWFKNNGAGMLDSQLIIHQEAAGFMYAGALGDINADGRPEPVWANMTGRVGYHINGNGSTAVNSQMLAEQARLYPNPAQNVINVETVTGGILEIRDILGRRIAQYSLTVGKQIIYMSIAQGVYLASILQKESKTTVRLIIE